MNIKQIILDLINECDNKNNKLDLSKTKQHLILAYHAVGDKKKQKPTGKKQKANEKGIQAVIIADKQTRTTTIQWIRSIRS